MFPQKKKKNPWCQSIPGNKHNYKGRVIYRSVRHEGINKARVDRSSTTIGVKVMKHSVKANR